MLVLLKDLRGHTARVDACATESVNTLENRLQKCGLVHPDSTSGGSTRFSLYGSGARCRGDELLGELAEGAGGFLRLELGLRLRGGGKKDKKSDKKGQGKDKDGDKDAKEKDDDEEPAVSPWRHLYNVYTGKTKSVLPMATFVFLEVSAFLLAQIATTFMVISNWGVEDIPLMILGVAVVDLPRIVVSKLAEERYYQRTIVANTLIITQVVFVIFRYCYAVSTTAFYRRLFSATTFIAVEIALAYNVDAFWILVEESCNIQQGKTLCSGPSFFSLLMCGIALCLLMAALTA